MKNRFIMLLSIMSFSALAQTRQNINKNSGTVSNVLSTIDSIRFNGSSTTMEVVLQSGIVDSHSISDIQNVNFLSGRLHSCGADSVHNPNLIYGSMTDQEGNEYKTIVIGTQEWMAENIKTTIYRNGDEIANISDNTQWVGLTTGAWSFYNNDSLYDCPYGKLYNWFAVTDPRYLCPIGWHVPTDAEWTVLTDYLGWSLVVSGKMKSSGFQYWTFPNALSPSVSATNESGFSGLPGGQRNNINLGYSTSMGSIGFHWSSSESDANSAWFRGLLHYSGDAVEGTNIKQNGFSVRCLRD